MKDFGEMDILLIDDHALFRDGLSYVLERLADNVRLYEAADAMEALAIVSQKVPLDLVLLDLDLGESDGMSVLTVLRNQVPELPVVVVSATEQPETIQEMLDAGVLGYIPKSSSGEVMLSALRLVLSGGLYIPPVLMAAETRPASGRVYASFSRHLKEKHRAEHSLPARLTARQIEVLALMSQGLTNRQIGQSMALAETTVKTHVRAIFKGLDVSSRTQAVLVAQKLGLSRRRG